MFSRRLVTIWFIMGLGAWYLWLQFDYPRHTLISKISPKSHVSEYLDRKESSPVNESQTKTASQIHHLSLEKSLSMVQNPVFIVYGNRGYRQILGNFMCNIALFPSMFPHLLLVVTDNDTADYLRSFRSDIIVTVSHLELHEAYDFETQKYLKLMLSRGLVLIDLLKEALKQQKTLVWIEPDFHYYQNLLDRPEITETVSDIVLFRDHEMYCGCFIRFSPCQASLTFYSEVMDRMYKIQSEGGMTNDQILLNNVVSEQSLNFTVFDKCLYRSGLFNKGGFMSEYQRVCDGIRPVAQHHNWIVGAGNKVQMAKDRGGWFLAHGDEACSTRDMLVVVMTMNRVNSLKRLLGSLERAQYSSSSVVDLRITVDRNYNNETDTETLNYLNSYQWSRGNIEVCVWPRKVGIFWQWVHSWPAEAYDENLYKIVVFLEDDLEVSQHFPQWFIGAHQAYSHVTGVGAITGQRPNLVAALNGPESVSKQVPSGVKAFGYMLIATWSLSPQISVWREFRRWVTEKRANHPDFVPNVEGIVPDKWYNYFKSRGEEENMWEMWFIRFMHDKKLHTVYPWVENGEKTIVGNWMEAGLHFSGTPSLDFPIANEWDEGLLTQEPLPLVGYALKF